MASAGGQGLPSHAQPGVAAVVGAVAMVVAALALWGWTNSAKRKSAGGSSAAAHVHACSDLKDDADEDVPLLHSEFRNFVLIQRTPLSRNVARLKFALPARFSAQPLNLPVGKHVQCVVPDEIDFEDWDDADVPLGELTRPSRAAQVALHAPPRGIGGKRKPYTPVSTSRDAGFFELVVKRYPEGCVSQYLHALPVGRAAAFRGPTGLWSYPRGQWRELGFVAGGTGITPMLQVIHDVLVVSEGEDRTRLSLVYSNSTVGDVLCRAELEGFCRRFPEQIRVHLTVSRFADERERAEWLRGAGLPATMSVGEGRVTAGLFRTALPAPTPGDAHGSFVLFCGPRDFGHTVHTALEELGFQKGEYRKM